MNYIITDEGVRVLEEQGLKKVVDENFSKLDNSFLTHWYDDQIEDYVSQHRIHLAYKAKVLGGKTDATIGQDEFKVFSFIVPNQLVEEGKIPGNLPDTIMSAIGTYFLTEYITKGSFRRSYSFRDKKFLTQLFGDVHGDFFLSQYNHLPQKEQQTRLWQENTLVKKLGEDDIGGLYGHYDYWTCFLEHLIMFCCQTGQEVPFRNDWEKIFYNGKIPSEESGMVIRNRVEDLKRGDIEFLKNCLPRIPGWEKQKENGWHPLEGRIENSQGFIVNGNLVYYHEDKKGKIKFGYGIYGKPKVIFTPDMIKEAIYGTVKLIRDGAGRNASQDPGLIFKYFPYQLFQKDI